MPIGAAILAIGYLMLSIPSENLYFLYASMGVIVVGNGLFKANAANMVRRIYEGDDAKIDSAFTLYYMAVNVGSTVSMLLTPWIKDHWGWHAGFTVCCAGLLLGLVNYVLMVRTLKGIGSAVDEQPVRWDRLGIVLGIGFACVFVVAFIVQHKEVTDLVMWIAGLVVLGIFGYMMVNGSSGERAGLIADAVRAPQRRSRPASLRHDALEMVARPVSGAESDLDHAALAGARVGVHAFRQDRPRSSDRGEVRARLRRRRARLLHLRHLGRHRGRGQGVVLVHDLGLRLLLAR
jgi:hypothetical protein